MRRREFIALVGAMTWPLTARAQQSAMPVIGLLESERDQVFAAGLRKGLSESGYVEGQNLAIDYHSADGQNDRLTALAADLVRRQVAVIVAAGTPATAAGQRRAISLSCTIQPIARWPDLSSKTHRSLPAVSGSSFTSWEPVPNARSITPLPAWRSCGRTDW